MSSKNVKNSKKKWGPKLSEDKLVHTTEENPKINALKKAMADFKNEELRHLTKIWSAIEEFNITLSCFTIKNMTKYRIFMKYFGLADYKPKTLREVAKEFHLSPERIRQIINWVFRKIIDDHELRWEIKRDAEKLRRYVIRDRKKFKRKHLVINWIQEFYKKYQCYPLATEYKGKRYMFAFNDWEEAIEQSHLESVKLKGGRE